MIRDTAGVTASAVPPPRNPPPAAPPPPPGPAAAPVVNPRLRLDAALNLVVIEFRDDGGDVTASIPSPRELDAYRSTDRAAAGREAEPPPRLDLTG